MFILCCTTLCISHYLDTFLTDLVWPGLFYKEPCNYLSDGFFSSQSSRYHKSQIVRARGMKLLENIHPAPCVPCHLPCVICHMSGSCVRCHVLKLNFFLFFLLFFLSFFGQSTGASWLRVCYQLGLPCLVKSTPGKLLLPSFSPSSCQCSAGEQSSWLPSPASSLHERGVIANPGYLTTC